MDDMKLIKAPKTTDQLAFSSGKRRSFHQTRRFWLLILTVSLILIVFQKGKLYWPGQHQGPALPVVVALAQAKEVPVYLSALGAVTPTYSVTVKTMINGILLRVFFREGQMVKTGDLLAEIDPRPFQAQLVEYEGQLQRDRALLANALIDLKRYSKLYKEDSISQQTLATQQALVEQYRGAIKIDQGLIDTVKINLVYCEIIAPINGRIGLRLVDPGNFVQTSDTSGIAVINTLNPITVIFTIAEDYIPQVLQQMDKQQSLPVEAYDRSQQHLLARGSLLTMDNQVDPNTGTVKLRAQFSNADNHLFPSQFVNVKLLVNVLHHATVVQTAAIQYSAKEPFVYVLNSDNTVSMKPVVVGVTTGDYTTVTGVTPGQFVVVDGTDKLTEGAFVLASNATQLTKLALQSRNGPQPFKRFQSFHERALV
jgi:multidrug efflux system membrane fusion protein